MSSIGASANRRESEPILSVLPSTNWKLPKAAAFWLMAVIFGLLLFSAGAPTPLYAVYQAEWHFSSTKLTIIFGTYGLGVLTALVAFGALSDRIGRRPVLAASLITIMISMLLPWLVCFPRPVTARVKIQGQRVLQNRPTLVNAYTLTIPEVSIPTQRAVMPREAKINSILAGFPLLKRSPMIMTTIRRAYM